MLVRVQSGRDAQRDVMRRDFDSARDKTRLFKIGTNSIKKRAKCSDWTRCDGRRKRFASDCHNDRACKQATHWLVARLNVIGKAKIGVFARERYSLVCLHHFDKHQSTFQYCVCSVVFNKTLSSDQKQKSASKLLVAF